MSKMVGYILSLCGLIGVVFSVYFFVDNRYALASDLQKTQQTIEQLSKRLDQKIVNDRLEQKSERLYELQDRWEGRTPPKETKDEMRQLQQDIDALKDQLKKLEDK